MSCQVTENSKTNIHYDSPSSTNTKKYLTNLVSVGIAWYRQSIKYCCQYNSSIAKVLSQYSSDGFLSVWYDCGTDSGDFHKTF
jgi:hypothetical protein